jgi:hypothetical protein
MPDDKDWQIVRLKLTIAIMNLGKAAPENI